MRNLIVASGLTILASACGSAPLPPADPPVLRVTSPMRSLVQDHAGTIAVSGTVAPNEEGAAVDSVMVNNVAATVGVDGSWTATIQIQEGASLIHTVATGHDGGEATDTRSVQAGELRAPGSNIENALSVSLSADAFAKISNAASSMIKTLDISSMVQSMNPMQHSGDENGPDCLYDQAFVDSIAFSDAHLSLVPVQGGIQFQAVIDGGDVHAHVNYAVACIDGSTSIHVTATQLTISGVLTVTPKGNQGFNTVLNNPNVNVSGLNVSASGLPGAILDLIDMNGLIASAIEKGAEAAMNPIMNQALGALSGPLKLPVLGHTVDVQVDPSDVSFDGNGGLIVLNTTMLIEGTENSPGYIFTDNGMPSMDPKGGFQLGLADDLANEVLSELNSLGILTFSMPANGGSFYGTAIAMTVPPMISANSADHNMHLVLGDMMMTFTSAGTPVAKAAVNATVDLQITPAAGGYSVGISLGTPNINVDVLPDVANETHFTNDDLAKAVEISVNGQIDSISKLLGAIPVPAIAGLQVENLSIGGTDGYVMVNGMFQ
jgi:hypothetical protein